MNAIHDGEDNCWKTLLEDKYELVKYIDRGHFGKVFKIRESSTHKIFALKLIYKKNVEFDEVDLVQFEREKRILKDIKEHPFVLQLHGAVESSTHLALIMTFVEGLTFPYLLERFKTNVLSEKDSAFYVAEISLALHHLHVNGVIHRDVTMNNVMVEIDGHIKLIDYGFSKDGMGFNTTTSTMLGQRLFLAPEIIFSQPYSFTADWYFLGGLLCCLLTGDHPFKSVATRTDEFNVDELMELYRAARDKQYIFDPNVLSSEAFDLIDRLLDPDPKTRMGSCDDENRMEIKEHPFFSEIDWTKVLNKQMKPPFVLTDEDISTNEGEDQDNLLV